MVMDWWAANKQMTHGRPAAACRTLADGPKPGQQAPTLRGRAALQSSPVAPGAPIRLPTGAGHHHLACQGHGGLVGGADGAAATQRHAQVAAGAAGCELAVVSQRHFAPGDVGLFGIRHAGGREDGGALGQLSIALPVRKGRYRQHHTRGKALPRAEVQALGRRLPVAIRHALQHHIPRVRVQRAADRKAGVAKAAGELQRPQALLVGDQVHVDVAAVAAVAEHRRERRQRGVEQPLAAPVGHDGAHLAGQLAQVPREKPLVLEIHAHRLQKLLAVEIRPHAHFHAVEVLHEHVVHLGGVIGSVWR
jgi:hypothetical protein